jgi:uncharacterized NAD(P)/FAD-binding protein YdhS
LQGPSKTERKWPKMAKMNENGKNERKWQKWTKMAKMNEHGKNERKWQKWTKMAKKSQKWTKKAKKSHKFDLVEVSVICVHTQPCTYIHRHRVHTMYNITSKILWIYLPTHLPTFVTLWKWNLFR